MFSLPSGKRLMSSTFAVMVWLPIARVDMLMLAVSPDRLAAAPMLVPLSLNCTVPVAVPALEVTVAVKVTLWPKFDGLTEESTPVAVLALAIVNVCDTFGAAL